ncbi:MAG TPA: penicillin-binding protein activator [Steroidobacteraceae bacterium]|nr:penicillin-binding protein activator [Steroidobacteraceae bacterium]
MLHATLRRGQVRHAVATLLLLVACGVLWPGATPLHAQATDPVEAQAAELAQAGRHLEAAGRYEQAARRGLLSWDARLGLLGAREYLAAGERDEARRLANKVRNRVRDDEQRALLALVDGGLALDQGDAPTALAALRIVPMSIPNALAADVLALRGRAEFATGQTLAGVRSYESRGALLVDGAARVANERELFDQLLLHAPPVVPAAPGMSERERGWLELPGVVAGVATPTGLVTDPAAAKRVRDWLTQHPGHPGTAFLPRSAGTAVVTKVGPDAPIAVLLPLQGRQQAAAHAVRDGIGAAWFASASGELRPRVEFYDTSTGAGVAYARAVADGARVVVGPLLKEDVLAVLAANPSGLPVPTLALNHALAADAGAPLFFYQFALDPEEEARAIARRIADDGLTRGIALFPEGAWGRRVHAAFVDELQRIGSVVLMTPAQFYPADAQDFSGPLRAALGRYGGAGDRRANRSQPPPTRNAAAEQATGPQFAFIAATPATARQIRPQLRFQMTYDLPMYTTADAWDPSVRTAADMDGMVFPEMPWLLHGGLGAPDLWDAVQDEWQARARGRLRLFAFGFDALRLAQQLGSGASVAGVQGLTGSLELLRDRSHVRRGVQFARIENGRPVPAPVGVAPLLGNPATNAAGQPATP